MTDAMQPRPLLEWPKVSVILPVRNEEEGVESAIRGILDQDYPGKLEVVVADGESEDSTPRILEQLKREHGILVVANPKRVTPAGLNEAIKAASGEVIVRCDGHSTFPPGYIRRAVELLSLTGAANVGGIQRALGASPSQKAIALAMTSRAGVGDSKFHFGGSPGPTDTVYLGVFRRSIFDSVGLFEETMIRNQDYELNYRIRQAGETVYFHPDLEVEYRPRSRLRSLWKQYWQYGRYKRLMLSRDPAAIKLRQLAPPALVVGLIASALFAFTPWWRAALLLPATYLAFLVGATLVQRGAEPLSVLMRFPAALAFMHIAWGAGFLVGLR